MYCAIGQEEIVVYVMFPICHFTHEKITSLYKLYRRTSIIG